MAFAAETTAAASTWEETIQQAMFLLFSSLATLISGYVIAFLRQQFIKIGIEVDDATEEKYRFQLQKIILGVEEKAAASLKLQNKLMEGPEKLKEVVSRATKRMPAKWHDRIEEWIDEELPLIALGALKKKWAEEEKNEKDPDQVVDLGNLENEKEVTNP